MFKRRLLIVVGFLAVGFIWITSHSDKEAKEAGFSDWSSMQEAKPLGIKSQAELEAYRVSSAAEKERVAKLKAERTAAEDAFYAVTDDQQKFVNVVAGFRSDYNNAANDLAKGGTRNGRKNALCEYFKTANVEGWVGKISDLSTNGDGQGVLTVEVGPNIWVGTWNNSLSDIGSNTLIDPNGRVFSALSAMAEGQRIKFDGSFLKARQQADCLSEQSVTLDGSMTKPEFVFKFKSVEQYKP